jgi:HAD superfamily hydrolase (TIGR01509 family)
MNGHREPGQSSKRTPLSTPEGVIFDMDGVLIDSHALHRHAWRRFLASLGKDVADEQLDYILEGRRREEILRYFLGDLPRDTLVEYGQQKGHFFRENLKDVQLIPGVRAFLEILATAGIKTGIATSASSYRTRETLEVLDLKKFAVVITGDDVPIGKPDPTVYECACQAMQLPREELLVLEDAPCGVQAAKAAGIRCVGVSSNGRAVTLSKAGADHVIPDFRGLSIERLSEMWRSMTTN